MSYDVGARKVLELTFRSALRLGHNYIATEHILLALLEVEDEGGPSVRSASSMQTWRGARWRCWRRSPAAGPRPDRELGRL